MEIQQCSSGSQVATFQYKCSKGSTLWQLRLESRNFSVQGNLGSSGSKVATCQYKCSNGNTPWQLWLESRNFSVQGNFGSSGSKVATSQTPDHIHFLERTRKIKFWIVPDVSHPFFGCDGLSARFDAQSAAILLGIKNVRPPGIFMKVPALLTYGAQAGFGTP